MKHETRNEHREHIDEHIDIENSGTAQVGFDADEQRLTCVGEWTVHTIANITQQIEKIKRSCGAKKNIEIMGNDITHLDTAGALLLHNISVDMMSKGISSDYRGFSPEYKRLLTLVAHHSYEPKIKEHEEAKENWLVALGKYAVVRIRSLVNNMAFVGEFTEVTLTILRKPNIFPWALVGNSIWYTGVTALPIVAMLSLMIGIVLTYQLGLQLQSYGANIFIVNLVGLAVLREFAPLLTAIIMAGRTGSAYTAQLGTMKLNEEIDALRTMGVSPMTWLVFPRVFALIIVLPLLTVWSAIFGVWGGIIMSQGMLNVDPSDFLRRFQDVIELRQYFLGLIKAPVFAVIISIVGCYQGMEVTGSATSVGKRTTRSVVHSIFLILVADAMFSVIYSWMDL